MIPDDLARYFWDSDTAGVDLKKNAKYVIERLLEIGDEKAIKWLEKTYGVEEITKVLKDSRELSDRSANFWAAVFKVNPKEVLCLSREFRRKRESHWR